MKPHWKNIPDDLLESLLWDIDSLDYDPYESSMAECIHGILNGIISGTNEKIIDAYWKGMGDEDFKRRVTNKMEQCQFLINRLNDIKQQMG